jgi:hypothetical protein
MDSTDTPFDRANYLFRKAAHARWHRQVSKQHILRSQLGFTEIPSARPKACRGCSNYHGIAYGYSKENRSILICGSHPYGWHGELPCPDWHPEDCETPDADYARSESPGIRA